MNKQAMYGVLKELEKVKTSNTTLISVYVAGGKDVGSVLSSLAKEKSLSQNIKSKATRQEVQSALDQLRVSLQGVMCNMPAAGLALFAGYYV